MIRHTRFSLRALALLLLGSSLALLTPSSAYAEDVVANTAVVEKRSIDSMIDGIVEPISKVASDIVFFSIPVGSDKIGTGDGALDAKKLEEMAVSLAGPDPQGASISSQLQTVVAGLGPDDEETADKLRSATAAINSGDLEEANSILDEMSNGLKTKLPVVLLLLAGTGIFLTVFFKFINLRGFALAIKTVRGRFTPKDAPGEITHFQALCAALSATVGLGNIAGVAVAISLGGPGATFWMILMGICGMTSKFCECTLGVKYRKIDPDGKVRGGAMYYLRDGLAERGLGGLGKVLAVFFAIMCIGGAIGAGNMYQVNQAHEQFVTAFGRFEGQGALFGAIIAVVTGLVIIGGIKSIGRVTAFLVPIMCIVYVIAAAVVICTHFGDIPMAVGKIINGAFSPEAVGGGFIGVLIQGIKRAAFSNEAGVGSAPMAHAAVKTDKPASEGLVALLEPFVDTVIVCTMTALVIIITGAYQGDAEGVAVTSEAFGSVISWFPDILAVAVILFAFSTMISWSYYGEQAAIYLFGNKKAIILGYKIFFCLCAIVGPAASLTNILNLSDAMFFAMVIPNLIGLYILLPVVKREVADFIQHAKAVEAK